MRVQRARHGCMRFVKELFTQPGVLGSLAVVVYQRSRPRSARTWTLVGRRWRLISSKTRQQPTRTQVQQVCTLSQPTIEVRAHACMYARTPHACMQSMPFASPVQVYRCIHGLAEGHAATVVRAKHSNPRGRHVPASAPAPAPAPVPTTMPANNIVIQHTCERDMHALARTRRATGRATDTVAMQAAIGATSVGRAGDGRGDWHSNVGMMSDNRCDFHQ